MMTGAPGSFLDESSCAGRENLDIAHVERYDAQEDASAASEVALLQSLGLACDSLVVEFGAGIGQFAVEVASGCARVTAVDVSEPMLTRLRSKLADHGVSNVEIIRGRLPNLRACRTPGGLHLLALCPASPTRFLEGARTQPASPDAQSGWRAAGCGMSSTSSLPRTPRPVSRLGARPAATLLRPSGAAQSLRSTSATSTPHSPVSLSR